MPIKHPTGVCVNEEPAEKQSRGERQRERLKTKERGGVPSDPTTPTRRRPGQSARGYANDLAAPHRPCPGGDVTRTSLCLALQGLRQKQQRT